MVISLIYTNNYRRSLNLPCSLVAGCHGGRGCPKLCEIERRDN